MREFTSFSAVQRIFLGIEVMHMLAKDHIVKEAGEQGQTPAEEADSLAA